MIVDAALKMFLSHGFSATSVDQIAATAGISKSTFYSRFSTKAEVFHAVITKLAESNINSVPIKTDGFSLEDRLYKLSEQFLAVVLTKRISSLERLMMAEAQRFPYLASLVYELATMRAIKLYEDLFRDAIDNGEEIIADPRAAAEDILDVVLMGPLRRAALGVDDLRLTADKALRAKASIALILNGCRARR